MKAHALLCPQMRAWLIIHIKTQPSQKKQRKGKKSFICHISAKALYSEVTKLTEMTNEERAVTYCVQLSYIPVKGIYSQYIFLRKFI